MNTLVTGSAGFIGSHIVDRVYMNDHEVYAAFRPEKNISNILHIKDKITMLPTDMQSEDHVKKMIEKSQPDIIYHMAAQSYVTISWKEPVRTMLTNVMGTMYLFEAVRKMGIDSKIIVACSSAEYGLTYENEIPIKESKEFRPTSPYAVSKIGQDMLSYQYAKTYGMKIFRARFFNITGPRKVNDACSDFIRRVVDIEKGKSQKLLVGNLESVRDITDVQDCINGMNTILDKGKPDVYNICSGNRYKIKDIVDIILSLSVVRVKPEQDPEKLRITDDPIFIGDNSKIKVLGWSQKIPIEKTLADMMEYWRKQ
ncbi:MAG: GDP-mannose 4,6-dehydratase [Candidatus Aenigmarchaeota archaeon]|nr:GDP-mannose 4,6-dehydratase [Candidatus Aenigmarchaeota archaeon]